MPTLRQSVGSRPLTIGQSPEFVHVRPSKHSERTVPAHVPLLQSRSVPHGAPGVPRLRPAPQTDGPSCHDSAHTSLLGHAGLAVPPHAEQEPPTQAADTHSAPLKQRSPSTRDAAGTHSFGTFNTGCSGSPTPHTCPAPHA